MATDEREWTLEHRLGWEHWTVRGPSTDAEIVKVAPLGRAETAEQRVREVELEYEGLRLVGVEALDERDRAETKLTAAVEALKDALGLIDLMADESQCVLHDEIEAEEERLQQALSEIEQGDTK